MAFSLSSLLGGFDGGKNPRPPYEGAYIYILLFFVGMLTSKYLTTYFRADMLPVGGITKANVMAQNRGRKQQEASIFSSVKDKNIFNADHFIPDSISEKKSGGPDGDADTKPVLSSLPLKLVGTIIHARRERSVATVQVNGKDIFAVMAGEEVEDMARIRDILRYKVIFRNLRNRKLEYIEIKEENKIQMGVAQGRSSQPVGDTAQTNFSFKRAEINKYLENLPRVLQDAKAVPYVAPGSGGEISGFKLVAIKTGSIYETLGLKRGDIIKGVNGEPVDSPQKAMELYQALKSSDSIQLEVTRGGTPTTLNYTLE
jgi:general secretion pathway protein C